MNLVALTLLGTAFVTFGAFHFLAFEFHEEGEGWMGWQVWPDFFEILMDPDFSDTRNMIVATTFLTHGLMAVASPFLILPLRASRWLWWVAVLSSGIAMCGLGGIILLDLDPESVIPGPGFYCILASLALNFLGLLFICRETPTISPPP